MPIDPQSIQIAIGIAIGILTILGTIFGWFKKVWHWAEPFIKPKSASGIINLPTKTMVLIPVGRQNALWWHMGTIQDHPGMQIVGDLNVTNISNCGIFVIGTKLKKPKVIGKVLVRAHDSSMYGTNNIIPQGSVSDLRFDFFVQPPVCEIGETLKADVAIIDQFGNEHWLKGLEFHYS